MMRACDKCGAVDDLELMFFGTDRSSGEVVTLCEGCATEAVGVKEVVPAKKIMENIKR